MFCVDRQNEKSGLPRLDCLARDTMYLPGVWWNSGAAKVLQGQLHAPAQQLGRDRGHRVLQAGTSYVVRAPLPLSILRVNSFVRLRLCFLLAYGPAVGCPSFSLPLRCRSSLFALCSSGVSAHFILYLVRFTLRAWSSPVHAELLQKTWIARHCSIHSSRLLFSRLLEARATPRPALVPPSCRDRRNHTLDCAEYCTEFRNLPVFLCFCCFFLVFQETGVEEEGGEDGKNSSKDVKKKVKSRT